MADFSSLMIIQPIAIGIILGLLELFFVHADEAGMNWFSHGLHTIPFMFLFVFISMNLSFVIKLTGLNILESFWIDFGLRALVGIIAMVKISGAAAIVSGTRIGEKWYHIFIIGALIVAAPYVWPYIQPAMPGFLKGSTQNATQAGLH